MPSTIPLAPQFPKKCFCGHVLVSSPAELHSNGGLGTFVWRDLPLKGYQTDEYEKIELRDCACGSTLAIVAERYKEDDCL